MFGATGGFLRSRRGLRRGGGRAWAASCKSGQMQLQVDVTIIGAGPAGTLLAYLLAEQYDKPWASGCCVSTLGSFMLCLRKVLQTLNP